MFVNETEAKEIDSKKDLENKSKLRICKPVIDLKKCIDCMLCVVFCPDNCIEVKKRPAIDYNICPGCLVCLRECPVGAISEER